ncbi:MAG: hypothetical protein ACE5G5_08540 [Candidatus Methylomirabilales bacterium]
MITEYLFLSPSGEIMYNLHEIRRYIEEHHSDRRPCPRCGCYLIPTGETHRFFFRTYRCVNSICSASLKGFRLRPRWQRGAA